MDIKGARVALHCHPSAPHQRLAMNAMQSGFNAHGIDAAIVFSPYAAADIHVCAGPWFALRQNIGRAVLYIDRAYWGDPHALSVHWLDPDGEKITFDGFPATRSTPEYLPYKRGDRKLLLLDYGADDPGPGDYTIRRHPASGGTMPPLSDVLASHDIAIGNRTTALVDAALAGLVVLTEDRHSPAWAIRGGRVSRRLWLNRLAWHNWNHSEIENGAMLNALRTIDQTGRVAGFD